MSAGADGYVRDLDYVDVVHSRMAPVWLDYVAALQGVARPRPVDGYDYCDLGCGTGLSLNVLAASDRRGRFVGIDVNTRHVARAEELRRAGGLDNARFLAGDFTAAAAFDLPKFDYIALYGVMSWVGPEARRQALDFVRARLKPGGLVLVAYNVMPGSAALAPLRRFMLAASSPEQATTARIAAAREALAALKASGPQFLRDHGAAARALDAVIEGEPGYLAHEYFNAHWHLPYFAEMRADLAASAVDFVGSAMTETNSARLCIPKPLRPLYDRTQGLDERELIKDMVLGRKFRLDVFARGGRRVTGDPHVGLFDGLAFALPTRPGESVPQNFRFPAGRTTLRTGIAEPLIAALANGPVALGELARRPGLAGRPVAEIIGELTILIAGREAQPARGPQRAPGHDGDRFRFGATLSGRTLDTFLAVDRARFVAAPALGTGLHLNATDGAILLGLVEAGLAGAAQRAADLLKRRRLGIAHEGGRLTEPEALARHLARRIDAHWRPFLLDRLLAFGVIEPAD